MPPKLWFKLQQLKKVWNSAFGAKEQSYDATLRMCPNCRALIERNASVCPLCGMPVKAPRSRTSSAPGRVLGVIPVPSTATSVIVAVTIAVYGLTWYLTQNASSAELSAAPSMGGIRSDILVRMGAKYGPFIYAGQWWRLVTAIFLHAGLFHIGMNLWCLFDLGPAVESLFSTTKFIVLYLVTGVAGFVLSLWWNPRALSIGASGAILGLIGILIGASFHHGGLGKDYRSQLWRWVIYILIFGLLPFFAVDNAAHIGGLATGLILGYLVPEGEPDTRSSENLWNTLAIISVLVIAGSFVLMALQMNRYR
ncbi:MAG TPA: rhomboid family intramembrane serine protease [Terriglobia bacterium]|nr:rhomboid family intramembrane serine protease [Terriglobia bacterium]